MGWESKGEWQHGNFGEEHINAGSQISVREHKIGNIVRGKSSVVIETNKIGRITHKQNRIEIRIQLQLVVTKLVVKGTEKRDN